MSFGISAAAWAAIAAGVAVAGTTYAVHSQNIAASRARKAQADSLAQQARDAAKAETDAQVSANEMLVADKRRRRTSSLGLGDLGGGTTALGGGDTALAAGAAVPSTSYYRSAGAAFGGTALGAGAPASFGVSSRGGGGGSKNAQQRTI